MTTIEEISAEELVRLFKDYIEATYLPEGIISDRGL